MGLGWLIKITRDRKTIPQSFQIGWSDRGPQGTDILSKILGWFLLCLVSNAIFTFSLTVQETGIKTIPKKKKCKKAKWLSGEALQIAVKRREVKNKGEKERYTHLNAAFQRTARRHKKAFLNNQCKEIEKNNRLGKTRDLFKKIRDTTGTFPSKMGSIRTEMVWT